MVNGKTGLENHRIEVGFPQDDPVAAQLLARLRRGGCAPSLEGVVRIDVITLRGCFRQHDLTVLAKALGHPLTRPASIDRPLVLTGFHWALEVGFLPGVTDNVGRTVAKLLPVLWGRSLEDAESCHGSRLYLLRGTLPDADLQAIAAELANPLVERVSIKSWTHYSRDGGMDRVAPGVALNPHPEADEVNLEVSEAELLLLGKAGLPQNPGEKGRGLPRRGPLALDLESLLVIQRHFRKIGRHPTDLELESLAQNWSEHCRHLIFNSPLGEARAGLFHHYIRRATLEIQRARDDSFCASVFVDNSGAIVFDEDYLVTDKVETHNSPSALDPFGGALTGILGVNRDAVGFGLGARPILNRYGFCLPWPGDRRELYRVPDGESEPLLPPRLLAEGIFRGVEVGGNCSGIPTPQGFWWFHEDYRAKPLVFVGTVGLIPREEKGRRLHQKRARPGNRIVVVGGRVGLDGIHGATFSSEALDSGSPATAVQIGDPIGQKLLTDALIREARHRALYTSLTDNGAGGLSCSVPEMAQESGGCIVDLTKVPLKYPGMAPWQIWVSESQERMTLAVPPEHLDEILELFRRRDVEATEIGQFTDTGQCVVSHGGKLVMDLALDFLLDGWPARELPCEVALPPDRASDPELEAEKTLPPPPGEIQRLLLEILARPGIASRQELALRFDHEVQGSSVLKPLVGPGRVDSAATVVRPRPDSYRGIGVSQGLWPEATLLDPYSAAAGAMDAAVRPLVALGARLGRIALLDNFCWSKPKDPQRLWLLKESARACYEVAVAWGTPFISGKDSMHNDFSGYDGQGRTTRLSIPPTLLISSLAILDDVRRIASPDPKAAGDLIFLLGTTRRALGGSVYRAHRKLAGGAVPELDLSTSKRLYGLHAQAVDRGLVASAQALGRGGLAVAVATACLAAQLGAEVDLDQIRSHGCCDEAPDRAILFSESPGRLLVTCSPENAAAFEEIFQSWDLPVARIGLISGSGRLRIRGAGGTVLVDTALVELASAYGTDWRDTK